MYTLAQQAWNLERCLQLLADQGQGEETDYQSEETKDQQCIEAMLLEDILETGTSSAIGVANWGTSPAIARTLSGHSSREMDLPEPDGAQVRA